MSDKLKQLKDKLKELFQMDRPDLDFGFYRIMHAKQAEIEKFMDEDLLPQVKSGLAELGSGKQAQLKADIDEAILKAKEVGIDPEQAPKVKELRAQYGSEFNQEQAEDEVYSHLYNFFARYYSDGDFMSMRRYKEGVYSIPYEGEEVYLHWANKDQYYIKTSENLKNYTFKLDDSKKVTFRVLEADTEKDNKKAADDKDRQFILDPESVQISEDGTVLVMGFEYRPADKKQTQKVLIEECVKHVQDNLTDFGEFASGLLSLKPTEKNKDRTLLEKHLTDYTAKHTFDYFIHKDLGGFLRRELDFYIKNEVMHLDDIEHETAQRVEQYLTKVKVIRRIASKIIAFLAQLEDFQKKLWLKKKFVVETNYCITLDRVPKELYPEIAKNDAQWEEWEKLGFVDLSAKSKKKKAGELALGDQDIPAVKTVEYLKAFTLMPIDTRFFDGEFKQALLASVDDFDQQCDGLLIHSENLQALNLINSRFQKSVPFSYIDPPFNLGESADYLYRVDYKDATWMALLQDRLNAAKHLIKDSGSTIVRCNHDGNMLVRMFLNSLLGADNYRNEIIVRRAEESKGDLNKQFAGTRSITVNYDNLYWYSLSPSTRFGRFLKPTTKKQSKSHWHSFWKAEDRPNLRYDILGIDLRNHYGQWMWSKERAFRAVSNYQNFESIQESQPELTLDEYWKENKNSYTAETGFPLEFVCRTGDGYSSIKYWIPPRDFVMADNNWLDIKGYANKWGFKTENSEGLLKRIIESLSQESDCILDYFAGSGTTAAVAHKLRRKWITVEMGDHIDSTLMIRLYMVLNGEQSGISKEVKWQGGGCFKYIRLESYEDCMNNLNLSRSSDQDDLLLQHDDLREDYMLNYMLDIEAKGSILNVDAFEDPFAYKMNIATGTVGETKPVNVDLVETFNYLIGLKVKHIDSIRGVRVITGENLAGERILVLWRKVKELDSNALDDWFKKQGYNTQDMEFDVIYVNGDNNLENLKKDEHTWKVRLIEEEFQRLMFEEVE